jgi:hypothetical protein
VIWRQDGERQRARFDEQAIDSRSRANERTRADYRADYVGDLDEHFKLLADVALADLTTVHVAAWEADRREAELSDKTIRNLHGFGVLGDGRRPIAVSADRKPSTTVGCPRSSPKASGSRSSLAAPATR